MKEKANTMVRQRNSDRKKIAVLQWVRLGTSTYLIESLCSDAGGAVSAPSSVLRGSPSVARSVDAICASTHYQLTNRQKYHECQKRRKQDHILTLWWLVLASVWNWNSVSIYEQSQTKLDDSYKLGDKENEKKRKKSQSLSVCLVELLLPRQPLWTSVSMQLCQHQSILLIKSKNAGRKKPALKWNYAACSYLIWPQPG